MTISILDMSLALLETGCVVAVFAYVLVHTRSFEEVAGRRFTLRNTAVLIVAFGLISVFGTLSGITVTAGAIANIRDVGPVIAGLVGGPVIGVGAGLIGGLERYPQGGITALSSSSATVISGFLAGLIYWLNKKKYVGVVGSVAFAIVAVGINLGLGLLIAKPFDQVLSVVEQVMLPMVIANGMGALVFAYIIDHTLWERRVSKERDEFRGELERKNAELNIARDIQMSFLPDSVPALDGYDIAAASIPANEVGGDFYDFVPVDAGHTGLVIADVSGKSVSAALFMALSRADLRANAFWGVSAADTVARANSLITQDSKSGMFVTLFYGVLDAKGRTLTYVNAGHNPPVLVDEKSGTMTTLNRTGIALGALEDMSYGQLTIPLESGTTLVLYTDGVTEACRRDGEMFGEVRLNAVIRTGAGLPAKDLLERIKAATLDFCDGAPQADDMTLMVVKIL